MSDFALAQEFALFERGARISERLTSLRVKYGPSSEPVRCADCLHFQRHRGRNPHKVYFKCALYGSSMGAGTDWRANWPGCGAFKAKS